ncbi:MAG: hypothetical protein H7330_01395 [Hymenobacteraceae bacterium]|nr:hypothetical protein [Hymenobacteraceae bacterium]
MNQLTRRRSFILLALALLAALVTWLFQPPVATQSRAVRLAHRAVRWPRQWVQGRLATADRHLRITLDSAAWQTLTAARAEAIRRGLLPKEAKTWVPARVQIDGGAAQTGKVRLKGDYPDHWAGAKWSLRIQLPPDARPAWGMRVFSVQDPATREFLIEWLLHRLLRTEGLLAIRYEFGFVTLNGDDKGVFAIEESFGPELLTANGRRGVLLKFDETALIDPEKRVAPDQDEPAIFRTAAIVPFDEKRVLTDSTLAPQFRRGRALLAGVRAGTVPLDSAFDAAAAGKLYAVCDLFGAHHATRWKNSRFAYDPRTDRLTLIAYDGNAGERIAQPYPTLAPGQTLYEHDDPPTWKARVFTNAAFLAAYRAEAARLSAPGFLTAFLYQAEPHVSAYRRLMYRDRPTYDFDWLREGLEANQAVLRTYVASASH